MKVTRTLQFSIGFVATGATLILGFFLVSYLFMVTDCIVTFDNYLSEPFKGAITQFCKETFLKRPFYACKAQLVQEEFSFLKTINLQYQLGGKTGCFITGQRPLLLVNENLVLLSSGLLHEATLFASYALQDLPGVFVKNTEQKKVPEHFQTWAYMMPSIFFEKYYITWVDHTHIELQDKDSKLCTMIAQHQTVFDTKLITLYEQTKKHHMSLRCSYSKKRLIIDVRFKNQIVVTQRDVGDS